MPWHIWLILNVLECILMRRTVMSALVLKICCFIAVGVYSAIRSILCVCEIQAARTLTLRFQYLEASLLHLWSSTAP